MTFQTICVRKNVISPLKVNRDKYKFHKNAIAKGQVLAEERYVPRIIIPLKSRWIKYGCWEYFCSSCPPHRLAKNWSRCFAPNCRHLWYRISSPFLSQPWWWVNTRSRWINPLEGDIWCRHRRSRSGRQLWTMEPSLAQIRSLPVILHPAVITNTQTDRNQVRLCCPKM